ncbi:MAG: hypothetical protein KIT87_05515 [Anaerolineae bacterium]|nr:hypothetical protein [Anaerolineae bacterium]
MLALVSIIFLAGCQTTTVAPPAQTAATGTATAVIPTAAPAKPPTALPPRAFRDAPRYQYSTHQPPPCWPPTY